LGNKMAQFIKENVLPLLMSALIALSAYLVERTIIHTVEIDTLKDRVKSLNSKITEIYKHLDSKIERIK